MSVEHSDFEKFYKRLEKEFGPSEREEFMKGCVNEISSRIQGHAKELTPSGITGEMKRSWKVKKAKHKGQTYEGHVYNGKHAYAWYVEFGHRQRPGRYIPGEWTARGFEYDPESEEGMVLKDTWVPGKGMLSKSINTVSPRVSTILNDRLTKKLRRLER